MLHLLVQTPPPAAVHSHSRLTENRVTYTDGCHCPAPAALKQAAGSRPMRQSKTLFPGESHPAIKKLIWRPTCQNAPLTLDALCCHVIGFPSPRLPSNKGKGTRLVSPVELLLWPKLCQHKLCSPRARRRRLRVLCAPERLTAVQLSTSQASLQEEGRKKLHVWSRWSLRVTPADITEHVWCSRALLCGLYGVSISLTADTIVCIFPPTLPLGLVLYRLSSERRSRPTLWHLILHITTGITGE